MTAVNVLLLVFGPFVVIGGLGALARWSAHQHADRWARDIRKVHGERPRPLRQEVSR